MSVTEIFRDMSYGTAPESAALANEWLDAHGRKFKLFIDGEFVEPASVTHFPTENPATGKPIAQIAQANADDIDKAVRAARQAQKNWVKLGGHGRAKVMYAIARQIQKHARLFAVLESMDNGKPIRETRDLDIPLVARHFYHHAGWAQVLAAEFPGYEAVGVCGQIIPWNFPLLMLAWKIAPAIAAGNTVVLKPAEFTSLTALLFAEICQAAGVPKGVVNIVTGDGESGRLIVEHPDIDKIAFTGSTEVGRIIRKATAGTDKKLSLELGGKSPYIIFEDADLDSAVEGLVDAIWFNQGQVCCAGSRLLVQESVNEKVIAKIKARMDKLRIGDPLDKAVDVGAIVAQVQLQRISELVKQGCDEGASLYQSACECPKEGWFYPPTLLTGVEPASTVAQVEIFGPVLVAMTFRTPAEAVALANNTVYGLAATVWTENLNLAHDVASKIKAGTIWTNSTNLFDAASGFGGYRESGYGREGGREGMYEYLRRLPAKSGEVDPAGASRPREGEVEVAGASRPRETSPSAPALDKTHKLFIGGKQVRPDGGYAITISSPAPGGGREGVSQEVGRGNRKDIRNAVEAATAALPGWSGSTSHNRAQILYYLAENLDAPGRGTDILFTYAAMADKYDGAAHSVPLKSLCFTRNEPVGVIGIVLPDEGPLDALLEAMAAAVAMGNTVVLIPSEANPIPAVELYRVIEASDVPAGVINIVTGLRSELVSTLAEHDGVDAIWDFGPDPTASVKASVGNLKQTWTHARWGDTHEFLRHATQVKNVWVPYGE